MRKTIGRMILLVAGIEKKGLEGSFLKTKIKGETKIITHE